MTGQKIDLRTDVKALDRIMTLDHVVRVHPDGTVSEPEPGSLGYVHAPELSCGTDSDGSVLAEHERKLIRDAEGYGWEIQTGWSGQNSGRYNGPCMHASEFIGGGLAVHILDTPGLWVAIETRTDDDAEPDSWLLLHRPDPTMPTLPEDAYPARIRTLTSLYDPMHRGSVTTIDTEAEEFDVLWDNGITSTESLADRDLDWAADSAEPFTHNPWTQGAAGARWSIEIVIARDGETDSDVRYTTEEEEPDEHVDTALEAWPGLRLEQILDVTVTRIGNAPCEGHYDTDDALLSVGIGEAVYCDGSCNPPNRKDN